MNQYKTAIDRTSSQITVFTFDIDRWVKVTPNVAQYSPYLLTYESAKLEVATFNGQRGMHFQEINLVLLLTLTLTSR